MFKGMHGGARAARAPGTVPSTLLSARPSVGIPPHTNLGARQHTPTPPHTGGGAPTPPQTWQHPPTPPHTGASKITGSRAACVPPVPEPRAFGHPGRCRASEMHYDQAIASTLLPSRDPHPRPAQAFWGSFRKCIPRVHPSASECIRVGTVPEKSCVATRKIGCCPRKIGCCRMSCAAGCRACLSRGESGRPACRAGSSSGEWQGYAAAARAHGWRGRAGVAMAWLDWDKAVGVGVSQSAWGGGEKLEDSLYNVNVARALQHIEIRQTRHTTPSIYECIQVH